MKKEYLLVTGDQRKMIRSKITHMDIWLVFFFISAIVLKDVTRTVDTCQILEGGIHTYRETKIHSRNYGGISHEAQQNR